MKPDLVIEIDASTAGLGGSRKEVRTGGPCMVPDREAETHQLPGTTIAAALAVKCFAKGREKAQQPYHIINNLGVTVSQELSHLTKVCGGWEISTSMQHTLNIKNLWYRDRSDWMLCLNVKINGVTTIQVDLFAS